MIFLKTRRAGYHGASHSFVSETVTDLYGFTGKMISCHLGGSCSLCGRGRKKHGYHSFVSGLERGSFPFQKLGNLQKSKRNGERAVPFA
ncbi:MAG: hypothetical protein J5973_01650 [Eubacterium sp.]|nr:hypothetical protein [Eubacterium sp.]